MLYPIAMGQINRPENRSGSAVSAEKSASGFKQVFDKSQTSQRQVSAAQKM